MAKKKAPLQVNKLSGGLNTEENPLRGDLSTSRDELNMDLNRDDSRSKRLGMDLEDSYVELDTSVAYNSGKIAGSSTFRWDNAGGIAKKSLIVVQIANSIAIFDLDIVPLSSGKIYSTTFALSLYENTFSFATVGGLLVVVTGDKDINIYEYDGTNITASTDTLLIRDLFGVESFDGSTNLTSSQNISTRPSNLEDTHLYNLRNQTFAIPKRNSNNENLVDLVRSFYWASGNTKYPSNSDSSIPFTYADANDTDNRLVPRFFSTNLYENPTGNSEAPKGMFIIDALDRGSSRLSEEAALRSNHSDIFYSVSSLPADKTPGGASAVADYAGRFWYGGFSSEITDGDSKSPKMGSYILFSQIIKDKTSIKNCYQSADPTSSSDPLIVASDGGYIMLDKAFNIKRLISVLGSLFVFAENGVWRVSGTQGAAFAADSYDVEKISDSGCISGGSVIPVDNSLMYWGENSIFVLSRNQFGVWESNDISKDTIQSHYRAISSANKKVSFGIFDSYDRSVRWVYNSLDNSLTGSDELRLQIDKKAFIPYHSPTVGSTLPKIISISEGLPYTTSGTQFPVTVSSVEVTVSGVGVTTSIDYQTSSVKKSTYVIVTDTSTNIKFSFGKYQDTSYYDWVNYGSSTTYDSYIITQDLVFGDPRSRKIGSYLHVYFKRTEEGFDTNLNLINPSSCLVTYRWGWSDATQSGKWTASRQMYRYQNMYVPFGAGDTYETGFKLISTRNKIRGSGPALAFKFQGEGGKNLYLYGWSFDIEASRDD